MTEDQNTVEQPVSDYKKRYLKYNHSEKGKEAMKRYNDKKRAENDKKREERIAAKAVKENIVPIVEQPAEETN